MNFINHWLAFKEANKLFRSTPFIKRKLNAITIVKVHDDPNNAVSKKRYALLYFIIMLVVLLTLLPKLSFTIILQIVTILGALVKGIAVFQAYKSILGPLVSVFVIILAIYIMYLSLISAIYLSYNSALFIAQFLYGPSCHISPNENEEKKTNCQNHNAPTVADKQKNSKPSIIKTLAIALGSFLAAYHYQSTIKKEHEYDRVTKYVYEQCHPLLQYYLQKQLDENLISQSSYDLKKSEMNSVCECFSKSTYLIGEIRNYQKKLISKDEFTSSIFNVLKQCSK